MNSAWNKGRIVGPKSHFTQSQVLAVSEHLQQTCALHDLCIFRVAIDSMLRCSDLLRLTVADVAGGNIQVRQQKTQKAVTIHLTEATKRIVCRWVQASHKSGQDFLFTRCKASSARAIHPGTYRDLIKSWAQYLGQSPETYSTHSLRRTKPHFLYSCGVDIAHISELLGHRDLKSTFRYLGISAAQAREQATRFDIFDAACTPSSPITLEKIWHEQRRQARLLARLEAVFLAEEPTNDQTKFDKAIDFHREYECFQPQIYGKTQSAFGSKSQCRTRIEFQERCCSGSLSGDCRFAWHQSQRFGRHTGK